MARSDCADNTNTVNVKGVNEKWRQTQPGAVAYSAGGISNLSSAEIKRGSMGGNQRGAMEKVEGDERQRGEKKEERV